jgi:hypothetical protein
MHTRHWKHVLDFKKFPVGNISPYIIDYLCNCYLKIVLISVSPPKKCKLHLK